MCCENCRRLTCCCDFHSPVDSWCFINIYFCMCVYVYINMYRAYIGRAVVSLLVLFLQFLLPPVELPHFALCSRVFATGDQLFPSFITLYLKMFPLQLGRASPVNKAFLWICVWPAGRTAVMSAVHCCTVVYGMITCLSTRGSLFCKKEKMVSVQSWLMLWSLLTVCRRINMDTSKRNDIFKK